jgi:hypothetical protein
MTETRWTPEQITAHATWLRATHGDSLESLTISETADDHGINVDDWTGDDWDDYSDAVQKILRATPDLTEWAIGLGAHGLRPGSDYIDLGPSGQPGARIHFAFHPDLPDGLRASVIAAVVENAAAEGAQR